MSGYQDRWITIDDSGIRIRAYYFPWGTKRVAFDKLRQVERVNLGLATGRARIWGTGNPTFSVWAGLDPGRSRKHVGFLIRSGARVRALVTPDDPDAAELALRAHIDESVFPRGTSRAPLI